MSPEKKGLSSNVYYASRLHRFPLILFSHFHFILFSGKVGITTQRNVPALRRKIYTFAHIIHKYTSINREVVWQQKKSSFLVKRFLFFFFLRFPDVMWKIIHRPVYYPLNIPIRFGDLATPSHPYRNSRQTSQWNSIRNETTELESSFTFFSIKLLLFFTLKYCIGVVPTFLLTYTCTFRYVAATELTWEYSRVGRVEQGK